MSSPHQDRLLVEESEPGNGTAKALNSAHGTSRRTATTPEKQATGKVPTQRPGTAQQSGTTRTPKTTATRKTTSPKTSTATTTAAADRASMSPAKRATTGKAAASAGALAAHAKTVTAPRPTPYKRTPGIPEPLASEPLAPEVLAPVVLAPVVDAADVLSLETPEVVRADASLESTTTDAAAAIRLPRLLRRRPPSVRRRAAVYLAAALVGALGVTSITTDDPEAQAAAPVSQSLSVAEQLGIEASNPTRGPSRSAATDRLGELVASRNARDAEQAAAAQAQAEADRLAAEAARPKAVFPIEGARLTSKFGPRWGAMHNGLDLAAPMMTPEYAAADGVVLKAGPASGFGLAVYIQHENGDVTVYGHMEEILVQAGQVVRAGESIALVGNRGQSTGPHLHFEVRSGGPTGTPIDPLVWLRERGVSA